MLQVKDVYYMRRADEERTRTARAATPEAKLAHQQLCDLYLARAGQPVEEATLVLSSSHDG